jgi:hypothetical protein
MDVSSRETSEGWGNGASSLAQCLPIGAMPRCMTSVRSATQYRQIRSLIQTEAQTYRTQRHRLSRRRMPWIRI